jgi:topoisomerase IA-like protein
MTPERAGELLAVRRTKLAEGEPVKKRSAPETKPKKKAAAKKKGKKPA